MSDDLITQMQQVGFTEYEGRCLLALMQKSPATVYDIAKRARMPRSNAYGALDNLSRKGAVQMVSENPVSYVPVDPDIFLGRISENTAGLCKSIAQSLGQIERPPQIEHVWSISQSREVPAKIDELIHGSERHVWIKGAVHLVAPHASALEKAVDRGVEVVIVLFGDEEDRRRLSFGDRARVYLHENSGMPVGLSNHLFSLTTDFSAALTASIRENGYGIYTHNRPVVVLVESLIRHEIYIAEIFARFGAELDAAFGPELLSLRRKYLPRQQSETLEAELERRGKLNDAG